MKDKELKELLAETTLELYNAGIVTGKGGNLSVRSIERENAVWITPSQIHKGGLTPEMMILIDEKGKKIEGNSRPSVESAYHAGLMAIRQDINAVVHTHAPMATVWGVLDLEIPPVVPEAVFIRDYPRVPFYIGGSKDLANAVLETVGQTKAPGAILCHHGLVTAGKDLIQAADRTMMVEQTLKIIYTIMSLGVKPKLLPENAVKFLSQISGAI